MPIKGVDVNDGLGKGLWSFLGQIVTDAAGDSPVLIFAREFLGVSARIRMRCTIGVAFHGDRGDGDDRNFGKPLFQIVIFRLAFGQAKPPAVVVDHDVDVVRVVERRCAAIEGGIIEVPLRRSQLPDELGEIVTVFGVAALPRSVAK